MCVPVQPLKDGLSISTQVRKPEARSLTVPNRTNMHWDLRPVVEGEYFSGPDTFVVKPQTTEAYEVTYHPLTMTNDKDKHQVCALINVNLNNIIIFK